MAFQVCTGAKMMCTFGLAPSNFIATPKMVQTSNFDAGIITDNKPMGNIPPFGACTSLGNPQVAAATSAALGVLTPQPCLPVIAAPWAPGAPGVFITNILALDNNCKLMCNWGGQISIVMPGQTTHQIP